MEFSTLSSNAEGGNNTKVETKAYGGRTFQMTMMKVNNALYSEILILNNATSRDGFSIININLPASGMIQCQQTVDQILASLMFGK
jgi:hypothetical protein